MAAGRTLAGRYRLGDTLGRGGMAEVYEAHDEVLDRRVAVKVLLDRFREDAQFVARFRREAQAAASLNHANIVAVYDTGDHDGLPFIVMELVRGKSLQQAVREGGLTEDRALEICAEVCAALSYAHGRSLVHRDVKPGNILLSESGQVKVTDFGIARAINAETVTQTAAVLGTAAYLSPEQAQGQAVDERSDIYSLGVVLYELLTGQQPFQGDSPVTVAYMHVQEAPIPLRDLDAAISQPAEAIAFRAMAKNPSNRYPDAEAMRDDLLKARVGQQVSAPAVLDAHETAVLDAMPGSKPPAPASTHRRRQRVGYVILALLSVAAAAASVFYLGNLFGPSDITTVPVPDVRGLPFPDAEDILQARGLRARYLEDVASEDLESGRIVRQNPQPNAAVPEGTRVLLSVSRGPDQVEVPQVVGLQEEEAAKQLRDAGLVPILDERVFDPDSEVGQVLSTNPVAGQRVPNGTQVSYVVSRGVETTRVPPLEGDTEADARFELEERGFEVLVVREFHDDVPEGRVIRQDPPAGTEREKGSEVTIVVSKGPEAPPEPSPSPSPTILPTEPDPSPSPSPSPSASPTDD
ncbi:MAG TPA: Stk1 family PASTA domain-containing Ser/Thr kinase [Nitriliruptorales bacterium]